jgi:hypothetical protein
MIWIKRDIILWIKRDIIVSGGKPVEIMDTPKNGRTLESISILIQRVLDIKNEIEELQEKVEVKKPQNEDPYKRIFGLE